jgi:hypothetical protein
MEYKIYKITCNTTGNCYIGKTINNLYTRLTQHESQYTRFEKGLIKNNYSSFKVIKNYNYTISLLETTDKEHSSIRERYYVENTPNCINKLIPNRSELEFRRLHRLENIKRATKWNKENREKKNLNQRHYLFKKKTDGLLLISPDIFS